GALAPPPVPSLAPPLAGGDAGAPPAPLPLPPEPPWVGAGANVAVTVRFELSTTPHDPVPEHPLLQPANTDPVAGGAVSVSAVPVAYVLLHAFEQTRFVVESEPRPAPANAIESVETIPGSGVSKRAVTVRATSIETMQMAEVPAHAPLQPPNVDGLVGTALRPTTGPRR